MEYTSMIQTFSQWSKRGIPTLTMNFTISPEPIIMCLDQLATITVHYQIVMSDLWSAMNHLTIKWWLINEMLQRFISNFNSQNHPSLNAYIVSKKTYKGILTCTNSYELSWYSTKVPGMLQPCIKSGAVYHSEVV